MADGFQGDRAFVVVREVRLDGLGGAVREEAEEEAGAVRVRVVRREVDGCAGVPESVAGLLSQARGDAWDVDVLVAKGRVVQDRAQ